MELPLPGRESRATPMEDKTTTVQEHLGRDEYDELAGLAAHVFSLETVGGSDRLVAIVGLVQRLNMASGFSRALGQMLSDLAAFEWEVARETRFDRHCLQPFVARAIQIVDRFRWTTSDLFDQARHWSAFDNVASRAKATVESFAAEIRRCLYYGRLETPFTSSPASEEPREEQLINEEIDDLRTYLEGVPDELLLSGAFASYHRRLRLLDEELRQARFQATVRQDSASQVAPESAPTDSPEDAQTVLAALAEAVAVSKASQRELRQCMDETSALAAATRSKLLKSASV